MKICLLSSILPVQLLHHSGKIPSFQSLFWHAICTSYKMADVLLRH